MTSNKIKVKTTNCYSTLPVSKAKEAITIYAQPARYHFYIEIAKPLYKNTIIEITNLNRQTILNTPDSGNSIKIQCGNLTAGIYLLKVISTYGSIIAKQKLAIQ